MLSRISISIVLLIATLVGLSLHTPRYFPSLLIAIPDNIEIRFVYESVGSYATCQTIAETAESALRSSCPECKRVIKACNPTISYEDQQILSDQPISLPSIRVPKGVIVYSAPDMATATSLCKHAEAHALQAGASFNCNLPGSFRPHQSLTAGNLQLAPALSTSLLILAISGIISMLASYFIVRYDALHSRWSHDHLDPGPQKFHSMPTPRIGGLAVLFGLLLGGIALLGLSNGDWEDYGLLLLAGMPAFLGGFAEDLLKTVGVRLRLILTIAAAGAGVWLLGGVISRSDITLVDTALTWAPFAIVLTLIAVAGAANAMNIIDGYNGLAAGYAVLALSAVAVVAIQVNDAFILGAALAMIGALLGFLAWNYPGGKIFLGDGGAYLVGFWVAELSILLVNRNSQVSAWFPMILLIYPVFETMFSIYRKKYLRGTSPGSPDGLHLHMLIYKRLLQGTNKSDDQTSTRRNSKVAAYIWIMVLPWIIASVVFWRDTMPLVICIVMFCVMYVWFYRRIVRWRAPRWAPRRTIRM